MSGRSEQAYLSGAYRGNLKEQHELYRAGIALASNGGSIPGEETLGQDFQALLEVRRLLYQGEIDRAHLTLAIIQSCDYLILGDRLFLLGHEPDFGRRSLLCRRRRIWPAALHTR